METPTKTEIPAKETKTEIPADKIKVETPAAETKNSFWKYSTFILIAFIIFGIFFVIEDNKSNSNITGAVISDPTSNLIIQEYPTKGNPNALVTIVEYIDYQCPYCERYFSQTYNKIKTEYIDTGKVKYVLKDFPLSIHEFAQKASEAAYCVREQKGDEGYFLMHDKIFSNQADINIDSLKLWAREIEGINPERFDSCLMSGKMLNTIQKSLAEGQKDGVQGTPIFFINGNKLEGAQPFSAFKTLIDTELKK